MYRAAIAAITAAYTLAIPVLAGLDVDTIDRVAVAIGLEPAVETAASVSAEQAIEIALAATIANHRPPMLDRFDGHDDAEAQPVIMASLN